MTDTEISLFPVAELQHRPHRLGDMRVRRIMDGHNSWHIEPAHNPKWSELTRLRWWAAIAVLPSQGEVRISVTHGLSARIDTSTGRRHVYDDFCLTITTATGSSGMSSSSYDRVKSMIDGIDMAIAAIYPGGRRG